MNVREISLSYVGGGSDKVYHCQIVPSGNLYTVNFQYGRRGSSLATGTKTEEPVSLEKANKIFDKLVAEKTGKGYTTSASGTPYQDTAKEDRVTGLVPQLLNAIDAERIKDLINDSDWIMQEKMDGIRVMVSVKNGQVKASNRKGLQIAISKVIENDLLDIILTSVVLDGEIIGDKYYIFDVLEYADVNFRDRPYVDRYGFIAKSLGNFNSLTVVPAYQTTKEKQEALLELKHNKAEGVVFKHKHSSYTPGRPNSGGTQLKYKFIESATCLVISRNEGKRSVQLGLIDKDKNTFRNVGNVTIPVNYSIPLAAEMVEVNYLYAYPEGCLYQPVYKGVRKDKQIPDTYQNLKFKQGSEEEV